MTGMSLPHAVVYVLPEDRRPHPSEILPELVADPDLHDRPVDLICELVTAFGEQLAFEMWQYAHLQLRSEKRRLVIDLCRIVRQLGAAA